MPLDVVKTKMQSLDGKQRYGNSLRCVWIVLKDEGVLAFWKGATPRLGRLMVGLTMRDVDSWTAVELIFDFVSSSRERLSLPSTSKS